MQCVRCPQPPPGFQVLPGVWYARPGNRLGEKSVLGRAGADRRSEPLLTEALEQQKATAEILRVIRQSPTQVPPIFDAIAQRGAIVRRALQHRVALRGEVVHFAARQEFDSDAQAVYERWALEPPHLAVPSLTRRSLGEPC
jgi:hypothetical protein